MNVTPLDITFGEFWSPLLLHAVDLTSLLAMLALTACALAGWGRLAVGWIGLQRPTVIHTFEVWIGFGVVLGLVSILHLIVPIDWRTGLSIAVIGLTGFFTIHRTSWSQPLHASAQFVRANPWTAVLTLLVLALWCSRAMSTPSNSDSGLYHFSSIRWMNEYSIVPGLGNLHSRLAFNQSYFGFAALMNFAPVWSKGYAVCGAFLLLLTAFTVLEVGPHRLRGGVWMTGLLCIVLQGRTGSLSSPTPDLAVAVLQIVIFLALLKLAADEAASSQSIMSYQVTLLVLCVAVVTIKLSAAIYALTSIGIAWSLHSKTLATHRIVAVKTLLICTIVMATHIFRGYILSGVPLYPSTFGGAWHLEWAMPIEAVTSETNWIYSWARRPGLHPEQVLGNWHWLEFWIKASPAKGWLMIGSALVLTMLNIYISWRYGTRRRNQAAYLLHIPLVTSLLFWFTTAPDWRFIGFIPELLAILSGWLFFRHLQDAGLPYLPSNPGIGKLLQSKLAIPLIILSLEMMRLKGVSLSGWQQIPSSSTHVMVTDSGLHVHVPVADNLCWDGPLPCTPYFKASLRGRWDSSMKPDLGLGFALTTKHSPVSPNSAK